MKGFIHNRRIFGKNRSEGMVVLVKFCPDCGRENRDKAKFCIECGEALSSGDSPRSPLLSNRYEIIRVVKSGGMGCIYKARDTHLDCFVAVKKMLASYNNQQDKDYMEKKFREEAVLLSQLHHGGLPKVSDFFITKDPDTGKTAHYLVMTFIEGKDLETIMRERGLIPLEVEETLEYFKQILEILSYLHSRKPPVIYRDLKPANVMLSEGNLFLVDFGIARIFKDSRKGTLIGTPGYASPEQYKGYTDSRSDLYSLGVLIYFLLTGMDPEDESRPPFAFEPVKKLNPHVPDYLAHIINSITQFSPENRPDSAKTVLNLLLKPQTGKILIPTTTKPHTSNSQPHPADQNPTRTWEEPPIITASREGDIQKVNHLISTGISVQTRNSSGSTPLHMASAFGHRELAQYLINLGADIHAQDSSGFTPLHAVSMTGHKGVAELLLSRGSDPNRKDHKNGGTPLHWSAGYGNREMVELLLRFGANIQATNSLGHTPLHSAAYWGHKDVVETLLIYGADIHIRDLQNQTPQDMARIQNHTQIVNLIKNFDSTEGIFQRDKSGLTPLHYAVMQGNMARVTRLISQGADINAKDLLGRTPLFIAMQLGFQDITFLLLHRGGIY